MPHPCPGDPPPRPRREWRRLCRALLLFAGALAIFLGVLRFYPTPKPKPLWTANDHTPPPSDFLYAMFPAKSAVELCDAPDGARVGTLQRALVNSQEEVAAAGWIRVNDANTPAWVRLGDLAYLPPPGATTDYFAAFDTTYRSRAGSQFASATLAQHNDAALHRSASRHEIPMNPTLVATHDMAPARQ